MMRGLGRWGLLFFLLASLPVLACNLVTGGESPALPSAEDGVADDGVAQEATLAPTAAVPGDDDAGEPPADGSPAFPQISSIEQALSQFNSYRIRMEMQFESSADPSRTGTMTMLTARVVNPPARSVELQVSGRFAEEFEALVDEVTVSFVEAGGESYSIMPGIGCVSGLGGAELVEEFASELDADDLLDDIGSPEYVGEETIDGVATHHYRFDETDLDDDSDDLRAMQGDIYVSQEHGHVVRMVIDGTGELDLADDDSDGRFHIEMNVIDVGQPITIEPPAACGQAAADLPIMAGASDVVTIAGLTTYSVNATLEDAITFYQEEMALRGYEQSADPFITDITAFITFTAPDKPSITVSLGADGANVDVLITPAP